MKLQKFLEELGANKNANLTTVKQYKKYSTKDAGMSLCIQLDTGMRNLSLTKMTKQAVKGLHLCTNLYQGENTTSILDHITKKI